ncbi:MAG TPA: permease [Candidatus Limnocylindrales bacterium]
MDPVTFFSHVTSSVATSFLHNWPFLFLGIVTAAALKVYVGTDRVAELMRRRTPVAVAGSVTAAVATPFCSCGTTAVVISMLASAVPWAPIVAFMVASPLSSPDGLVYSAGLFGWPFAAYFFVVSIFLGIAGGLAAHVAEKAGLLEGQARFAERASASTAEVSSTGRAMSSVASGSDCGCGTTMTSPSIGPGAASVAEFASGRTRWRLPEMWAEVRAAAPRFVAMYFGFAAIGYAAIELIPTAWLTTMLGGSSPLSVVFAATLGVPFYLNEGSLPLVSTLMHGGMGPGPAVAFLITGAGTSIGAVSGGLIIARWRVIAIVVGTLWVGAVTAGLIGQLVL